MARSTRYTPWGETSRRRQDGSVGREEQAPGDRKWNHVDVLLIPIDRLICYNGEIGFAIRLRG